MGAGAAGGSVVDEPPVELPPFVVLPLVPLPELELAPGADEVPPAPAPVLGVVVPAEPADDTFVFVELSADFV